MIGLLGRIGYRYRSELLPPAVTGLLAVVGAVLHGQHAAPWLVGLVGIAVAAGVCWPRAAPLPFSPFGAFSYSATIANLYSALNDRRDGRGEGPSADRGPDDGDTSPLPAAAARRSSDDTSTRISDHALCCEPQNFSCLT